MTTLDTTRRTLAQARRMPQWQRLIDSIHKAQEAKGYPGRQFGADEMRSFGETLIGKPAEYIGRGYTPRAQDFAAYWVARQETDHSDGATSVRYVLKAVYGDDLANVHTITDSNEAMELRGEPWETCVDPSPEWEAATALDFIRRANNQAGRTA